MLTTAAMCLSNDTKLSDAERSWEYLQAAELYGKEFVATSSRQLRALDQDDAGLYLTCSRLLTILGLAWFRVNRQHRGFSLVDEESWTWLHMLRGSATLHNRYNGTASERITDALANELADGGSPTDTADSYRVDIGFEIFSHSREARFVALYDAASIRSASLGPERAADALSAIESLQEITEELCSGRALSLVRSLCFWPCRVSKGFVDMLVQGNVLALAIYAHWLMPMVLAKETWFIDEMGCTGICEIAARCSVTPDADEERMLLHWPQRMLQERHNLPIKVDEEKA